MKKRKAKLATPETESAPTEKFAEEGRELERQLRTSIQLAQADSVLKGIENGTIIPPWRRGGIVL